MSQPNNTRSKESGGALIYVFIGVILFALLVFTFSKSQNGSPTATLNGGQVKIAASQIINYQSSIARTINKLMSQGCSETQISFENDFVTGYNNPNAPIDLSCNVFAPGKGKATWKKPPSMVPTPDGQYFFSNTKFAGLGENGGGIADLDLAIWLRMIPLELCLEINRQLSSNLDPLRSADSNGIPVEDNNPTFTYNSATSTGVYFQGNLDFSDYAGDSESGTGKEGRCIRQHNTAEYIYIGILLPR